jgi:hypothetical protein
MVAGAPSAPPASASATVAPPQPTEEVHRPDPGLARGRWESPAWAFWVVLAIAVAGGLAWLAVVVRRRKATR